MNKKKSQHAAVEVCPVPPWEPKPLLKLVRYLAISQAQLARLTGISYSTFRAWIGGRTLKPSQKTLGQLKKFEKKIPALRQAALDKISARSEKESRRASRLAKPWPINRIRSFMHTWGMSQAEFALFCDVSYDSVTSWSRGRRRLVRRSTAEHVEAAEKACRSRGFPTVGAGVKKNPWADVKAFAQANRCLTKLGEIPKSLIGTFGVRASVSVPGKNHKGKPTEKIIIKKGQQRKGLEVKIALGQVKLNLTGRWQKLGGLEYLELQAPPEDPRFFQGRAGCITPGSNLLRVSLWSPKGLPVRLLAGAR